MENWKDIYKLGEKYSDFWGQKKKSYPGKHIKETCWPNIDEESHKERIDRANARVFPKAPPVPSPSIPTPAGKLYPAMYPATYEEFEELVKILESYMRIHNIKNYDGIGLIEELDAQKLDGVIASLNQEELVELYQRVRQLLSLQFKETQSEETAS